MIIFDWILQNKEWVFSGIGVALLGIFISWLLRRKPKNFSDWSQHSGRDANIIQVGGDINISNKTLAEKKDSIIRIASDEEIRTFDPKVKKLIEINLLFKRAFRRKENIRRNLLGVILVLILFGGIIFLVLK